MDGCGGRTHNSQCRGLFCLIRALQIPWNIPPNTPPKAVFEVFNANLGCWGFGTEFHPATQASLKSLCGLPNVGATNTSNHTYMI